MLVREVCRMSWGSEDHDMSCRRRYVYFIHSSICSSCHCCVLAIVLGGCDASIVGVWILRCSLLLFKARPWFYGIGSSDVGFVGEGGCWRTIPSMTYVRS
jgi:hypothetical protein